MKLIIAEKPQVGRAIASAIAGTASKQEGAIIKGDYVITWALGHLLDLKDPEDYDTELKKWTLDSLPIYFPDWQSKPKQSADGAAANRLIAIGKLLKQADLVIHAGDPDDEGQYLIDEILRWHHYKGQVLRMDTNDTTPDALRRALGSLKDNAPLEAIGWSAHARRVADMIVGYNCSRYFSLNNPGVLLTIGRVQTATLGLVVLRDAMIEGHQKQIYYDVLADLKIGDTVVETIYEPSSTDKNLVDGRILSESYAMDKVDMLRNETLNDISITYEELTEEPPLPFNLTELQSYCSGHFGYDPSRVLEITQSLRDNYSAITYNRSDCQYLSEDQYKQSGATMNIVLQNIGFTPSGLDMSLHSRCFNNNNLTAHTAIIPQAQQVDIQKFTEEERNVYLAICTYFMIQFLAPAKKGKTKLNASVKDGGRVTAVSTVILFEGYRSLLTKDNQSNNDTSPLSTIAPGVYCGDVVDARKVEKETRPPARYTKASLAKDMTRIAKYVEDPEVKQLLLNKDKDKKGENGSIGTVATRAEIIDKLEERGYLQTKNKSLISTPLGRELYRILPNELKKPDMTAYWWSIQEDIQQGISPWSALTDSVLNMVCHVINTTYPKVDMSIIPDSLKRGMESRESLGSCPRCGCAVIEGKKGYGCSGYKNGCKFVIWKQPKASLYKNIKITPTQVKKWLNGGWEPANIEGQPPETVISTAKVKMKSLYSEKKGSTFEGNIALLDTPTSEYGASLKLVFEDPAEKPVLGKCPRCGGNVTEFSLGFKCAGQGSKCSFIIWKEPRSNWLSKTKFTAQDVTHLLNGQAIHKKTLLKKDGKTKFEADLIMDDDPNNDYGPNFKLIWPQQGVKS